MSVSRELQTAIFDALVADADVGAIVDDRIHDGHVEGLTYPCVTFGPSDSVEDDRECITGSIETVQIDCWTRSSGRLGPCKDLVDAVKAALHKADIELDVNALVQITVSGKRVFRDPDGITAHGVLTVEAILEEA